MAQPEVLWEKTYGGIEADIPYAVIPAIDSGCLMIGTSRSFDPPNTQAWIVKVDSDGAVEWTKDYGGDGYESLCGGKVTDDGYLLIGAKDKEIWILNCDPEGNITQERSFVPELQVSASPLYYSPLGGFFLTAYIGDRIQAIYLNEDGSFGWARSHNVGFSLETRCFTPTLDGGLIIGGAKDPGGDSEGFLVKLSADGDLLWSQLYGGKRLLFVAQRLDGNLLAKGWKEGPANENERLWTIITDPNGEVVDEFWRGDYLFNCPALVIENHIFPMRTQGLNRYDNNWNLEWETLSNRFIYGVAPSDEGGYWVIYDPNEQKEDFGLIKLGRDALNFLPFWHPFADTSFLEDEQLLLNRDFIVQHLGEGEYPPDSLVISVEMGEQCDPEWNGDLLAISPPDDWFGKDQIRLTAKDPENRIGSTVLKFTVLPINDPPEPFALVSPPDSSDPPDTLALVTFCWEQAKQNLFETDTVTYILHFVSDDRQLDFPPTMDTCYVVQDLRLALLTMGFTGKLPKGFTWWVTARDAEFEIHSDSSYHTTDFPIWISVDATPNPFPLSFAISSIHPNPFNSSTTIRYGVPVAGEVRLSLFDTAGRLVEQIVTGTVPAGNHAVTWNSINHPAGLYFLRLEAGGVVKTAKMVLVN